jgi:hypothetical protein
MAGLFFLLMHQGTFNFEIVPAASALSKKSSALSLSANVATAACASTEINSQTASAASLTDILSQI